MKWKPIDNNSQTVWERIVNESVASTLKRIGASIVNEMALSLKTFRQRVDGLRFQLIENWCLLKYCQLYSQNNVNIDHWGSEFLACAKNIRDFEIKGGINKQKTINKMFISDYDYNQSRKILPIIQDKFDIEKIHDNTQRAAVATEFSNSINSLITFLCDTSISNIKYMKTTFNMDILSLTKSEVKQHEKKTWKSTLHPKRQVV